MLCLHLLDPFMFWQGPWKEQIGTLHPPSAATAQQARSQRCGRISSSPFEQDTLFLCGNDKHSEHLYIEVL